MGAVSGPLGFIQLQAVAINTVWPTVFTTVAEQNAASLQSVIGQIGTGSLLIFLMAIVGITLTLVKKESKDKKDIYYFFASLAWIWGVTATRPESLVTFVALISLPLIVKIGLAIWNKNKEIDFKLAIILIIWFTSTLYASTKGVRFMLLLVPAASIGLGIASGYIYSLVSKFMAKNLYIGETISKVAIIILLVLLLVNPFNAARATAIGEIPSMNDAWYESLDQINREAEPDAIINSWWDFGHWFKEIGNRAVTFDGTSQGTPMAHWVGHVLMTNNEEKAKGILRMLDCGSNKAFETLDEDIKDTARSVHILHEAVQLERTEAKELLLQYVDEDKADAVLGYSHCIPPENYFITSDDMIGKSGVWAHFGSWDFDRALIYNTVKKPEYRNNREGAVDFFMQRFNYTEQEAQRLYLEATAIRNSDEANSWIAPWPSYASGVNGCAQQNATILCPLGVQGGTVNIRISLENRTAVVQSPQGNTYPNAVVFPTEEGIAKTTYTNNTMGFAMTLLKQGENWAYVASSPGLEDSMFTRLYFMDGHGLSKFKKFSEQQSVIGNRIVVWDVDWDGTEKNQVYFQPQGNSIDTTQGE
jgi:dolichyl-diphosphooligosaccharide--protein glycosyltransferase